MRSQVEAGDLGTGTEAQQLARLAHAEASHGLTVLACPACEGKNPEGCRMCDGDGLVFIAGDLTPCGASCPLHEARQ